jgi:signal transduction histidine kinase
MRAVVIEDSRTQAHRLRLLIQGAGFEVEVAEDGEQGIALCRARAPDVVVSDVLMPGIDGYETCRRLKATPETARTPVILLTSLADPVAVVRALAAGADNFVSKPYEDARLIQRIRDTIVAAAEDPVDAHAASAPSCSIDLQGERFHVAAPSCRVARLLVSSLEDAAERNAELAASREELARANEHRERLIVAERAAGRAREELLAIVAHDLRTPLGVVQLAMTALGEVALDDEARALVALSARAADQMGKLIRDLVDASTIEAGRLRFDLQENDPVAIVTAAAELLRPLAAQKHITVDVRTRGEPIVVRCDRDRILQVLSNVLGNAIKFTPERGRITLDAFGAKDHVTISVADTGPGISAADAPRIFERHWRGPGKSGGNTGLGLYIAKGIVEAHEGTVSVRSAPGEGTELSFTLPREPAGHSP